MQMRQRTSPGRSSSLARRRGRSGGGYPLDCPKGAPSRGFLLNQSQGENRGNSSQLVPAKWKSHLGFGLVPSGGSLSSVAVDRTSGRAGARPPPHGPGCERRAGGAGPRPPPSRTTGGLLPPRGTSQMADRKSPAALGNPRRYSWVVWMARSGRAGKDPAGQRGGRCVPCARSPLRGPNCRQSDR
jgi:hypothetical protein